uniref:ORF24 n=1 Tax=Malaco herpesvirus 1 TaxID=3031797 RepID=A0AA48P8C0_9VIRU|nr:TPA_asm: ORF24 [Malaco herpesvirus 1]
MQAGCKKFELLRFPPVPRSLHQDSLFLDRWLLLLLGSWSLFLLRSLSFNLIGCDFFTILSLILRLLFSQFHPLTTFLIPNLAVRVLFDDPIVFFSKFLIIYQTVQITFLIFISCFPRSNVNLHHFSHD